jgi:hypothetical protein
LILSDANQDQDISTQGRQMLDIVGLETIHVRPAKELVILSCKGTTHFRTALHIPPAKVLVSR